MTREELEGALEAEHRLADCHRGGFSFASMCGRAERLLHLGHGPIDIPCAACSSQPFSTYQVVAQLIARWWFDGVIFQAGGRDKTFEFSPLPEDERLLVAATRSKRRWFPAECPSQLLHELKERLNVVAPGSARVAYECEPPDVRHGIYIELPPWRLP